MKATLAGARHLPPGPVHGACVREAGRRRRHRLRGRPQQRDHVPGRREQGRPVDEDAAAAGAAEAAREADARRQEGRDRAASAARASRSSAIPTGSRARSGSRASSSRSSTRARRSRRRSRCSSASREGPAPPLPIPRKPPDDNAGAHVPPASRSPGRAAGPLGRGARRAAALLRLDPGAEEAVSAESVRDLLDPAFLVRLGKLELNVRRLLSGDRRGDLPMNRRGPGMHFRGHREYASGDDPTVPRLERVPPARRAPRQGVRVRGGRAPHDPARLQRVDGRARPGEARVRRCASRRRSGTSRSRATARSGSSPCPAVREPTTFGGKNAMTGLLAELEPPRGPRRRADRARVPGVVSPRAPGGARARDQRLPERGRLPRGAQVPPPPGQPGRGAARLPSRRARSRRRRHGRARRRRDGPAHPRAGPPRPARAVPGGRRGPLQGRRGGLPRASGAGTISSMHRSRWRSSSSSSSSPARW